MNLFVTKLFVINDLLISSQIMSKFLNCFFSILINFKWVIHNENIYKIANYINKPPTLWWRNIHSRKNSSINIFAKDTSYHHQTFPPTFKLSEQSFLVHYTGLRSDERKNYHSHNRNRWKNPQFSNWTYNFRDNWWPSRSTMTSHQDDRHPHPSTVDDYEQSMYGGIMTRAHCPPTVYCSSSSILCALTIYWEKCGTGWKKCEWNRSVEMNRSMRSFGDWMVIKILNWFFF